MQISCIGCNKHIFEVDVQALDHAKVMTFVCPECGEYTAVSERVGGGVIVAVDKHSKAAIKDVRE